MLSVDTVYAKKGERQRGTEGGKNRPTEKRRRKAVATKEHTGKTGPHAILTQNTRGKREREQSEKERGDTQHRERREAKKVKKRGERGTQAEQAPLPGEKGNQKECTHKPITREGADP